MFTPGQKVKFRKENKVVQATIDSKADFGEEPLWWIKIGHDCHLIDEASLSSFRCTCGAASVYAPAEPPGHGYKCDAS